VSTLSLRSQPRWWGLALTSILVAGAAILCLGAVIAVFSGSSDHIGWDYRTGYLPAAEAITEGESPYLDPDDPNLDLRRAYVYPPQLAIVLTPLTQLPADPGTFIVFLVSIAALLGALAVVGVRDLRCYAAVLLWAPTWNSLSTLNVSSALALGVALTWRYRATLWPLATTVGLMVSVKLFIWPLVVWIALTRRFLAACAAVAIGLAVTFLAWAAIGFAGLTSYLDLLAKVEEQQNYSVVAMATHAGAPEVVGRALALVAGGALLLFAVRLGRRGDEERAFTAAVAATLVLSPVIWIHYLTLLIAPLALARPRFSPLWLVPIVLWVSPRDGNGDGLEPFVPAAVTVALVALLLFRERPRPALAGA
jgi:hypothetical protein